MCELVADWLQSANLDSHAFTNCFISDHALMSDLTKSLIPLWCTKLLLCVVFVTLNFLPACFDHL